jgi:hypothetical protein
MPPGLSGIQKEVKLLTAVDGSNPGHPTRLPYF